MAAVHFLLGTLLLAVNSVAQAPGANLEELALQNAEFGTSLYRKIASTTDGNVVVSPLSVTMSLAALAEGAGGQSREQILNSLQLSRLQKADDPDSLPQLLQTLEDDLEKDFAIRYDQLIALFAAQQVESAFQDRVKKYFKMDTQSADFSRPQAAMSAINDYFRGKTGGKIQEVVPSAMDVKAQFMQVNTVLKAQLMLVNTVFFKGQWVLPFNGNFTQEERFFIDKYHIAQVPMMFRSDKYHLAYDPDVKVGILKLPSSGGAAVLIVFPDEDVDITSIDEEVYAGKFLDWVKKLKRTKLEVQLPRFSLQKSYSLKTVLPSLGMLDVFQENADLSTLRQSQGLKLDEVLQKTTIEVDERGSLPEGTPETFSSLPPRLTINRPFLFLVYHEVTKSLLLIGRVVDPTKN